MKDKKAEFTQTVYAAIRQAGTWFANGWTLLQDKNKEFTQTVYAAIRQAGTWFADGWTLLKDKKTEFTQTVYAAIRQAGTWFANGWTLLKDKKAEFTQTVYAALDKGKKWVKDAWDVLNYSGEKVISAVLNFTVKIFGKIWDGAKSIWSFILSGGGNSDYKLNEKTMTFEATADLKPGSGWVFGVTPDQYGDITWGLPIYTDYEADVSMGLTEGWIGDALSYLGLTGLETTTVADTVGKWLGYGQSALKWLGLTGLTTDVDAGLTKAWGTTSPIKELGLDDLKTTIQISLGIDKKKSKIQTRVANGVTTLEYVEQTKKLGGVFSNGAWKNIPQYAGGTLNAHGSLFLAGEAGPEIVGHVGGRTEVLNKSQIAAAMFAAVRTAMEPMVGAFVSAWSDVDDDASEADMEALLELIREGSAATVAQNELLRQQNEYLRQINDKDFSAEISTADIARGQQRMNRRAGVTVVPVGT